MIRPFGLNATPKTAAVCPVSSLVHVPVRASHSRGGRSALTVAILLPSGLKGAANTASSCPLSVYVSSPVAEFHTRAVLSSLAVLSRAPSGLKDTELTAPVWPVSTRAPAVSITLNVNRLWDPAAGPLCRRVVSAIRGQASVVKCAPHCLLSG